MRARAEKSLEQFTGSHADAIGRGLAVPPPSDLFLRLDDLDVLLQALPPEVVEARDVVGRRAALPEPSAMQRHVLVRVAQRRAEPLELQITGGGNLRVLVILEEGAALTLAKDPTVQAVFLMNPTPVAQVQEVADATIRCLRRYVPAAVPGIVFLSGGQSAEDATDHLNAMNAMGPQPWQVSFSYGRALQAPVLAAWRGQEANAVAAQKALLTRCQLNGLAREGRYARSMEGTT